MAVDKIYVDNRVKNSDTVPTIIFKNQAQSFELIAKIREVLEDGDYSFSGTTGDFSGDVTVAGTLNVTGAFNSKLQITDTGGAFATPIALTTAQSGRVILVDDAAGLDFTLPALAAGDVGVHFKFLVVTTITSNSFRVTAQAGDLLRGGVTSIDFDAAYTAPQAVFLEPDEVDDLIMTLNGGTTGGKKGTVVEFIGIHATGWFVTGTVAADGVIATPFS